MKTIWKFELQITDRQTIRIPHYCKPISVAMQRRVLCLWAEVDTDSYLDSRDIAVIGTGNRLWVKDGWDFVGTAIDEYRSLVWHVYFGHIGAP